MIYFSEIRNKKIATQKGVKIGILDDLTFLASDSPKITKLVIKTKFTNRLIIPIEYLVNQNNGLESETIFIRSDYKPFDIEENELFVARNILDKQIIDLVGHKVVRVNDIAIQDKGEIYLAGVDVGFLGILRWLKLANLIVKAHHLFKINLVSDFLSWSDIQPLELAKGKLKLKKEEKKLKKVRPEDLADYLEKTNIDNTIKIIRILEDEQAIDVVSNLNLFNQSALFRKIKIEKAVKWINELQPDMAVDILLTLSKKRQENIKQELLENKRQEIENLMELSKISSIGRALTTKCLTVESQTLVKEVMDKIKKETRDFEALNYIYVVNQQKQLVGVFNLHELLMENYDTPVYRFMMQNAISISLNTPKEVAIKLMLKFNVDALPVVDKNKHVLGMVIIDYFTQQILRKYE